MEALGFAASGAKAVSCLESSLRVRKSAHGPSTSAADFCVAFRASEDEEKRKLCSAAASCSPVGLAGDGLSCGVKRRSKKLCSSPSSSSSAAAAAAASSSSASSPRFSRRASRWTSLPRSAAVAAAAVESLEGTSLLKDIDSQDLEADTPLLLQQCSDLDWKKLVDDLRSEALHGLQSSGLRALSLKALEKLMESWIHEQMVDGIERPAAEGRARAVEEEPEWSLEAATSDLRMEANLQAAQMLAKGVDSNFDWETDVAELHQRILLQGGAEPCALRPEQRLWQAWADAQSQMVQTSNKLVEEAVASTSLKAHDLSQPQGQAESVDSKLQVEALGSSLDSNSRESKNGKSLLSLGAAVATGLAVEGAWLLDALADEAKPEVVAAASRAPSWLVPAVLIFPPLSYLLFNVYREKVNPYAKVTDWMFGVVALTIVSNLVMMAVWGVRLY